MHGFLAPEVGGRSTDARDVAVMARMKFKKKRGGRL